MTRNRISVVVLVAVVCVALARSGSTGEIKLVGMLGTTQQDELDELSKGVIKKDFFDHTVGGELQIREWLGRSVGVAFTAGALVWQPSEFKVIEDIEVLGVSGKLTSIPVGASAVLKLGNDQLRLVCEGGARYVFNNSSIDWSYSILSSIAPPFEFEFGDMVSGVAAADLELGIGRTFHVFAGASYMFPIRKAEVSFSTTGALAELFPIARDLGRVGLEAYFVRAGVVMSF